MRRESRIQTKTAPCIHQSVNPPPYLSTSDMGMTRPGPQAPALIRSNQSNFPHFEPRGDPGQKPAFRIA
jgi:hypothetical protein